MSKITEVHCEECGKEILVGDNFRRISWLELFGGGGDVVKRHSAIVHVGECLVAAEQKAYADEHPYGPNGLDLSTW